jgi:hypothetical protein
MFLLYTFFIGFFDFNYTSVLFQLSLPSQVLSAPELLPLMIVVHQEAEEQGQGQWPQDCELSLVVA